MSLNLYLYSALMPLLLLISCSNNPDAKQTRDENQVIAKERATYEHKPQISGQLIKTINFEVRAPIADYDDGIQPWIRIDSPTVDLPNLINGQGPVILRNRVTVLIDYPLKRAFKFVIRSDKDKGFSREDLIKAISGVYHQLYEEEEQTATVKTLPMVERQMYNRNETNGKYGVWGHDIGDLVLTEISVYITKKRQVILTMNIDS